MFHQRRSARCTALLLLGCVASCELPSSQLLVGVDTDLTWGAGGAIQSVSLDVRRSDGNGALQIHRITALGSGSGRAQLPLWVTVVSSDDADTSPVWVEALGCATADGCTRDAAVVAQRASVRFVRGEARVLRLLLAGSCASLRCALTERCAVATGQCVGVDAQGEVEGSGGRLPDRWADASVAADAPARDVPAVDVPPSDASATDATGFVDAAPADAVALDGSMPADASALDGSMPADASALVDAAALDGSMAADASAPVDASKKADVLCAGGGTDCGGVCVATASDAAHCGRCGNACLAGQVCSMGVCTPGCASGAVLCGGSCVRLSTPCMSPGSVGCARPGLTVCVGGAVQCSATPRTGGACPSPAGGVCDAAGECTCAAGATLCSGACVRTASDQSNCGACGNACFTRQMCSMGACSTVCPVGNSYCGGFCIATESDAANCGGCGVVCASDQTCVGGVCTGGRAGSLLQRSCVVPGTAGCGTVTFTGGTFTQGEGSVAINAAPEQTSTVGNFAIDAYEVTVARFRAFWGARGTSAAPASLRARPIEYRGNPSLAWGAAAQDPQPLDTEVNWSETDATLAAHPMNGVDYWLAQEFCVWDGGRLPTEAEWEFAARGSAVGGLAAGRVYPWGNADPVGSGLVTCDRAQFNSCAGADVRRTRRVGSFAATAGLFDMAGNVAEWTADNYGDYPACRRSDINPLCNNSLTTHRVIRGGSWFFGAPYLRAASRNSNPPGSRSSNLGFRCVRELP